LKNLNNYFNTARLYAPISVKLE